LKLPNLNLFKKNKYNDKIKKSGKIKIIKLSIYASVINLIVVSEKIITIKPKINVKSLSLE
jgi:hypothetical protein